MSKSLCVVVEFDEILNKTTEECQMDIVVRFWDTECQHVKTIIGTPDSWPIVHIKTFFISVT